MMQRWRKLFILIVALLVLWFGYTKVKDALLVWHLEQELARLRQFGEPVSLSDLFPPVPSHQDGSPFYRDAIKQWLEIRRRLPEPIKGNLEKGQLPSDPADVQKVLQAAKPALQSLRKALNFPHMRLIDWSKETPEWSVRNPLHVKDIALWYRNGLIDLAELLAAEGELRWRKGDTDGAVKSYMTVLKLVRRIGDDPLRVIGFLIQSRVFEMAWERLRMILAECDVSPQTYRALLSELQSWDIDRDFVRAIQSERVFAIAVCDRMRKELPQKKIHDLVTGVWCTGTMTNMAILLKSKSNLIVRNELKVLKYQNAFIAIARKGIPYDWKAIKHLEAKWVQEVSPPSRKLKLKHSVVLWDENTIARPLNYVSSKAFFKVAGIHAMQRIAQTAVALRLYRHEHGGYPETINELMPKYLPSVPIDPFDGKPLRYKRLKQGFKIWSVGKDMKDHDGIEGHWHGAYGLDWIEGDIVWEAAK